jgi:hypothetical protein
MEPEGFGMPDLSFQIGTLYKVIGQLESASDSRRTASSTAWWRVSGRWICTCYCLWFSLPLSIWLGSGWIGLFLYWQTLSGAACLVEKFTRQPQAALAAIAAGKITAEYCPVEGAAQ